MIGLIGGRRAAAAISDSVSAFGVAREACDFPKTEVSWPPSHFRRRRGGCFIREMVIIVMDRSVVSSPPTVVS